MDHQALAASRKDRLVAQLTETTEAAAVLWHFDNTMGHRAGSFTTKLIEAYSSADITNQLKLSSMYPTLAAAFELCNNHQDGTAAVSQFIGGH